MALLTLFSLIFWTSFSKMCLFFISQYSVSTGTNHKTQMSSSNQHLFWFLFVSILIYENQKYLVICFYNCGLYNVFALYDLDFRATVQVNFMHKVGSEDEFMLALCFVDFQSLFSDKSPLKPGSQTHPSALVSLILDKSVWRSLHSNRFPVASFKLELPDTAALWSGAEVFLLKVGCTFFCFFFPLSFDADLSSCTQRSSVCHC